MVFQTCSTMIYLGSHYYLLILENPRNMTCGIYLSMACQVSYPAISNRWGEEGRSYSLVKVSIYKKVGRSRQSCKLHTLKGVPFLNRRYKIGVPYLLKIVYKRGRGWASPFITFPEDLSHRVYKKKKGTLPCCQQEFSSMRLAWRNTFPRAFWLIFGWTLTISGTSTLSLLRFLPGLELLTGCWQPLTSKVYQETRTESQTCL